MKKIVAPHMVSMGRSEADTGAVRQPEPLSLRLTAGDLQSFLPPESLHPLMMDLAEGPASRLFNEWAGLQFLGQVAGEAQFAPRFYGGDRERVRCRYGRFRDGSQNRLLALQTNPVAAERGLVKLAEMFGKMHARTVEKKRKV